MEQQSVTAQRSIGPIKLSPGVTPMEIVIFLVVISLAQTAVSFVTNMQPFIYSDILHLPAHEQGQVGGWMQAVQQAMLLIFVGFAGALADRWGRRLMLSLALVGFAISLVIFPLVSSVMALLAVRVFFGLSQNGHTAGAPTKMLDYPDNASRGKFMALIMVTMNLSTALLFGVVASHLPAWLKGAGMTAQHAGRTAFWIVAVVAIVGAAICRFGLQDDKRPPVHATGEKKRFFEGFADVWRHALKRPAFALMMVTGFVLRSDVSVLQAFLSLWIVQQAQLQGLSTLDALKIVGWSVFASSIAHLIVPPIMGVLLDRINRVVLYCGAVAAVGFTLCSVTLVTDVTSWQIYAVLIAIGVTEAAQTICQQSLFGQEAPADLRGTAYGVSAVMGAATVVVVSAISGILFDKIGPTAPFVLVGLLHFFFVTVGIAVMRFQMRRLAMKGTEAA